MKLLVGVHCIAFLFFIEACSNNTSVEGAYCNKMGKGDNRLILNKDGDYIALYIINQDTSRNMGRWIPHVQDSRITDINLLGWKTLDPEMDSLYRCGHCDMDVRKIGDRIIVDPDIDEHDYHRCSN
ncbi:MAG TPA: hypothetical protein VJZ04_05110 [Lachnospiraceae bacterium]|nr:hypothetical protein [Lachnospiraceae bacterium]